MDKILLDLIKILWRSCIFIPTRSWEDLANSKHVPDKKFQESWQDILEDLV